jgi:hypothetical protein
MPKVSLDHVIGAAEQRERNDHAKGLRPSTAHHGLR